MLMVAWMNREALDKTAQTAKHITGRARAGRLWHTGEGFGHVQKVRGPSAWTATKSGPAGDQQLAESRATPGGHSCFFKRSMAQSGLRGPLA